MPFTGQFVARSTSGLLLVGLLALLGIVGTTFWLAERAQVYFEEVVEARDTRGAAVELRNAVLTAESSQRGFLYTGNEIYLAPYDTAKTLAQRQLDALTRLLAPYSESDVVIHRLTAIITDKFAEMDGTIALKRERREDELQTLVRSNRGKALMDEANIFFAGVIRGADERMTAAVAEERENTAWLRSFSIVGALVIVAVVIGSAFGILSYTRELRAARDEVGILNAELEQRVEDRTADLARANEEIKRFAHIVTHDLRSPLVNIMGFTAEVESSVKTLEALLDQAAIDSTGKSVRATASSDFVEAIGFIRSSSSKMDRLINAVLKLSREGRRTLRPEPVELNEVVAPSIAAMQHQLLEASGEIKTELAAPLIVTDRLSLEQILGNLLDNAVKYRAKDRPLRIEVRAQTAPGDKVIVEIADNGRGIAEDDRERVFELFSRSGIQDQPGEGLGLAYVRAVVRNLGGEITLSSTLDKGSTFRIVLPRTLQVDEATAAA